MKRIISLRITKQVTQLFVISHMIADPLHKVTIVPRGQALGFTAHIPAKESYNRTRAQLLAEMDVMMAGRAAEEQIFGIEKNHHRCCQ